MVALHANHAPERFMPILQVALQGAVEVTIPQLLDLLEIDTPNDYFTAIADAIEFLGRFHLEISPVPTIGSFEDTRLLRRKLQGAEYSADYARTQIGQGEGSKIEFKETFLFDIKKFEHAPGRPINEYRSDAVIHSALKTIAAFLNTDGGVLFIGVCDQGTCKGIERDFALLEPTKRNADGWELDFRNQVVGRFHDGKVVSNYFAIDMLEIDAVRVARVRVSRRARISFLKSLKDGAHKAYVRQGNNTRDLDLWELEDYVLQRNSTN